MKKITMLALLLIAALLAGCSSIDVKPGYAGIKVNLKGADKGVAQEILTTGNYWIGWNTEIYQYPTFTLNYTWSASANEGKPVGGG